MVTQALSKKRFFKVTVIFLLCASPLLIWINSAKAFPQSETTAWGNHKPMPPLIHIVDVQPNVEITLETENFPANQDFVVTVGLFGSRGVHGIEVGKFNSGPEGLAQATFPIPAEFEGAHRLAVRAEGYGRFPIYSFNWFENSLMSAEESSEITEENSDNQPVIFPLATSTGLVEISYNNQISETARTYYQYDALAYYDAFVDFDEAWENFETAWKGEKSAGIVWLWISNDIAPKEGAIADSSGDFFYAFKPNNSEDGGTSNEEPEQNQFLLTVPEVNVTGWKGYALNTLVTLPGPEQSDLAVSPVESFMSEQNLPQINSTKPFTPTSSVDNDIKALALLPEVSPNQISQGLLLIQVEDLITNTRQNTLVLISEGVTGPAQGRNSFSWYSCQVTSSRWRKFSCWTRGYGR